MSDYSRGVKEERETDQEMIGLSIKHLAPGNHFKFLLSSIAVTNILPASSFLN